MEPKRLPDVCSQLKAIRNKAILLENEEVRRNKTAEEGRHEGGKKKEGGQGGLEPTRQRQTRPTVSFQKAQEIYANKDMQ